MLADQLWPQIVCYFIQKEKRKKIVFNQFIVVLGFVGDFLVLFN